MSKESRQLLEAPFHKDQIKFRPGHFGQTLAYIEGHAIIRRLNEAFESQWSFEIVEHRIFETEVLVLAKLSCPLGSKMAFGGSGITHHKETGEVLGLTDDLKAAATDALKKAATLLGVGLHLYEDQQPPEQTKSEPTAKSDSNGNGHGARITAKQLAYLYTLTRSRKMEKDDLQRLTVERFSKMPDFLTKQQASDLIQELQAN